MQKTSSTQLLGAIYILQPPMAIEVINRDANTFDIYLSSDALFQTPNMHYPHKQINNNRIYYFRHYVFQNLKPNIFDISKINPE